MMMEIFLNYVVQPVGYIWISHVTFTTFRNALSMASTSIINMTLKKENCNTKVLFFPDQKLPCKSYLEEKKCCNKHCGFSHLDTSLTELIKVIASARKTLDVCVFTITSQDLADVLIQQHNKGIVVRVITDCEKMDLNCSQIEQFRANGIQVRHDKTSYFMHHKFAIVDGFILINGSFNWTRQAITGNQENLIISDQVDLLKPYCKQFEKLWILYKPDSV